MKQSFSCLILSLLFLSSFNALAMEEKGFEHNSSNIGNRRPNFQSESTQLSYSPPTQTRSIFRELKGEALFTEESLTDCIENSACWVQCKLAESPNFAKIAAKKILMLEKIEAEHAELASVYSGASYYIGALHDLFTALYQRVNKMEKTTDQYVFRSPSFFTQPFGPNDILKMHEERGDTDFDRDIRLINRVMCVTFSLLSTIENGCESSLSFWSGGSSYAVEREKVPNLITHFIYSITNTDLPLEEIKERTKNLLNATPKTGVLYQFFIHPDAIEESLSITRAWGVPLKGIRKYRYDNPTREFVRDLKQWPGFIKDFISADEDSFKETCTSWRWLVCLPTYKVTIKVDPTTFDVVEEKISTIYKNRPKIIRNNQDAPITGEECPLADVTLPRIQGRLIVNPQATMDPQKFIIKKHYWDTVDESDFLAYKNRVESFADWIMEQI